MNGLKYQNKISLNLTRTNIMVFTSKHIDERLISTKIEHVMVDRVHLCKLLTVSLHGSHI